ncbi:HAUS augmin-like complex subunit 6 isoform X1 [Periophthalmus magnuspinnatus]|uniref:HAUS augmin-like complex subunit 6 isoform X1 n=2 Tax=Periophthalmus magnuspinnatus TaxID=409849 RepID=UPI00145AB66F|nr:HAUS augmin-like complex subunit 6 isoform X1 [Periophthalmus magnuspinnatus]
MENTAAMQKRNGKYLWFAILGLGFNPETEISNLAIKSSTKHINLGPTMFDKPNKDAFYIVTHFLLEKLNPTRFNELYRHCWPVLNHKADAEFRKVTCAWLREIMDETANAGSKVQPSLFLSPGGPKFVTLMLHLSNHVMLQEMKTFNTDGSWVPEAAAFPASSVDMAMKRLNLIRARFMKTAVDQDRFLHEYQRRAQALVKSVRETQAEGAKYDELLKRYSDDTVPDQASLVEKARKVRALWSTIEGIVSSTQEERHSVQCVLKGDVDQYTLDGTEKALKISPSLLERIEQLPHPLSSGNVYEAGQLNLLSVLELTNHALQLLKEEKAKVSPWPKTLLVPEQLQEKCQRMSRVLQELHLIRQKISKEEVPEVKAAIRELELEWDRKWSDVLRTTPLMAFLNEDPALGFLSPMAPLSFEPAPEASFKSSIFTQYPAKLLDKPLEKPRNELVTKLPMTKSNIRSDLGENDVPAPPTEASSRGNTSLDWLFEGPSPPKTEPAPLSEVVKSSAASNVSKATPRRLKSEIIELECENLAHQFADAVTTTDATPGHAKGLDLEDLLSTIHGDPFSTRKQLPRTPESLIMDVKSSWRKAVEEDKAERLRSTKLSDSILGHLTPLGEPAFSFQSPFAPPPDKPKLSPPPPETTPSVCQQGAMMKSNLGWDTFNTEMDSPSGTGSSAVQFSLDHETLPEMPSCDSFLSLDDVDIKSEEEEASPDEQTGLKRSENLFAGQINQPDTNLLSPELPTLDRDWAVDPVKSDKTGDKKFSLDFDTLGSPSTPTQEYSLPKLITFSPIDDMSTS